jgi:hypothetical protein
MPLQSSVEKKISAKEELYTTPRRNGLLPHFHNFLRDR